MSLDLLAAGGKNLALNSRSSPLALQFLVLQRQFMTSIEHIPVVQRSDSSCTFNLHSDTLQRTTKRGTHRKDSSKKKYAQTATKPTRLSPCAANWRVSRLKNQESYAQQARSHAEIRAASTEGKANGVQREVSYTRTKTCQKHSSKICLPLGANFVNQPFCKSLSLLLLLAHPQISNGQRWTILKISHSTISLSKDCPWYMYWSTSPSKIPI